MLFHTWSFVVFFIVVYVVYLSLKKTQLWIYWLLVNSYFFYGWWNLLYLLLIVYSTLLDYVGIFMERNRCKMLWLIVSTANNLFLLGSFKSANFVTENANNVPNWLSIDVYLPAPGVSLPARISFYTFQSMSYTIDFYRGRIEREPNLIRFTACVSPSSQLVADPIERASALLPQLR